MEGLWTTYGFYLWALTTALVVIALAWLAWNTFTGQDDEGGEADSASEFDKARLGGIEEGLANLRETLPYIQATLGKTLQRIGVARGTATDGAEVFAVAVTNARGDGFVLSGGGANGPNLKVLSGWAATVTLTREESSAISEAQSQTGHKT